MNKKNSSIEMFGFNIFSKTMLEATDIICQRAKNRTKGIVVTPNVDHVVQLEINQDLRRVYEQASLILPDGIPIVWLSKLTSGPSLKERITGADLLPSVCKVSAELGISIFLMGGREGVADKAAARLTDTYSGLNVIGTYSPKFGFEKDVDEQNNMIRIINEVNPKILVLGLGAPKQELWALSNLDKINVGQVLCIGASIDFAAGNIKRAPKIIQKLSIEWLWRLLQEPGRLWRRYLVNDMKFIGISLREIFKN